MDTPGFVQENLTKPKISAQIEGESPTITPKKAAKYLLASVINGRYYISNDLLGELARVSVNGGAPRPNLVPEVISHLFRHWRRLFLH
jgi:3-dehydrosphinganine reductase